MRSPNSGHIAAIQRTVLGERAARRLSMVKALSLANALVQLRAILLYDTQPNDLTAPVCCNVR
jgi:hypothetical protein